MFCLLDLPIIDVSESDTPRPRVFREYRWGKILARRTACGHVGTRPNFFDPGGVCKETPRSRARPACAPERPAGYRRQRTRKASRFCRISAIVLRLWQV